MEDFRHISRLADIHGHERPELTQPHQLPGFHFNPRRILISLTVVVLGMIAWWGQ